MRAGSLDKRVVLLKAIKARDQAGQVITTWQSLPAIWANIRFLSGREYIRADREQQEVMASVRIRRRPVTSSMRLRHAGQVYEIIAVLPDAQGECLDLAVKAIQ